VTEYIRTIDELRWAQENNPELVQWFADQVTILSDLEKYLLWLSESGTTTTVISKLRRDHKRSLGIHPSSASKTKKQACLLKLYYECTHEIQPISSYEQRSQQTWDFGTLIHDQHQTHFEAMYGDQFRKEVYLGDERLHIKSSTDGVFSFPEYRFILEMKSIKEGGNYGWEKVQDKPFTDNLRQTNTYMKLADVPFGLILYINKNSGGLYKEHVVTFDQEMWDQIENETILPVIDAAYGDGETPPANPAFMTCKYCSFEYACPYSKRRTKKDVKSSRRAW
jgi:CRISPR/Cas system-associated exonuclease Cas4 (RecB family)